MTNANQALQLDDSRESGQSSIKLARTTSVLVVDTDNDTRKALADMLTSPAYRCKTATTAIEAYEYFDRQRFDAVISDVSIPCMRNMKFLAEVRQGYPLVAFLAVTGEETERIGAQAMQCGADDFLVKPFREGTVLGSLERAIQKRNLENQLEGYRLHLEEMILERTTQLREDLFNAQQGFENILQAFGGAIDSADNETAGHCRRVCRYSIELAQAFGLSNIELTALMRGAYLHDIGKIGIPDRIIRKAGSLTDDERRLMQLHPSIGFDLVKDLNGLAETAKIVHAHHERHDGKGYPRGLKGDEIPFNVRIFTVADTLDAITSPRTYRPAASFETALESIRQEAGKQFDPQVVKMFLRVTKATWRAIARGKDTRGYTLQDRNVGWVFQT